MSCNNCQKRRQLLTQALIDRNAGKVLHHAVRGAAELVGIGQKTAGSVASPKLDNERNKLEKQS